MNLKEMFSRKYLKRYAVMTLGNIVIGLGVALFRCSGMGTDPFNGMNLALAGVTGLSYPTQQVVTNIILFVVELIVGRRYIGVGTIVNAVLPGYACSFFYWLMGLIGLENVGMIILQLVIMVLGVVFCSLGLSLYQQSDVGVAPFDFLALYFAKKFPKIPYFWLRILCDSTAALICFAAGGVVGLGTVVTMFGLGPVVHFFDRTLTKKYIFTAK